MTHYIGRFAPSPSGPLHFGSLIAAVASFVDARAHGGIWRVRIEDIDETRCKPGFADDVLRTLDAFGLHWDGEVVYQTARKAHYQFALDQLRRDGHIYACACSRKEIVDSAADGPDGAVYAGTCRDLGLRAEGNALRVVSSHNVIEFTDRVQGRQSQTVAHAVGDYIVKRRDGHFAYQLAVVVDDALQGVTHIVRGADLLDSTARQIHLRRLLVYKPTQYLHHPVVTNAAGQKLSKQTQATEISGGDSMARRLTDALAFLGQDVNDLPSEDVSALLRVATVRWNVAAIAPRFITRCPV